MMGGKEMGLRGLRERLRVGGEWVLSDGNGEWVLGDRGV